MVFAHGSHHHKNAELTVRQLHQAARQQAQHNAAWNDEQRDEQQTRRGEHVRAREIILHSVDQHDGDADGHQIAADEGLDLRGHPALDRAEVAGRRQQQDNGDGCNGVKKRFPSLCTSKKKKFIYADSIAVRRQKNKASTEKKLKTEGKWAMIKKNLNARGGTAMKAALVIMAAGMGSRATAAASRWTASVPTVKF